jgi:hypothetical protein
VQSEERFVWELSEILQNFVLVKGKVVLVYVTRVDRGNRVWLHPVFNLLIRWKWVLSFTPQPLYFGAKSLFEEE